MQRIQDGFFVIMASDMSYRMEGWGLVKGVHFLLRHPMKILPTFMNLVKSPLPMRNSILQNQGATWYSVVKPGKQDFHKWLLRIL